MGLTAWLLKTFGVPTLEGHHEQMHDAAKKASKAVADMPVDTMEERRARFKKFDNVMQAERKHWDEE